MAFKKEKRDQQDIALERIRRLFSLAGGEAKAGESELAQSHVLLARSVGTRYNVRIPREFRFKYCKYCSSYLTAETGRFRLNSKERTVEVKCLKCGRIMKFSYRRPKRVL